LDPSRRPDHLPRWNAAIESGLIHARVLAEFLVPNDAKKPRTTDMVPSEFVGGWTPDPPDASELLAQSGAALSQHLAHLTWHRVRTPGGAIDTPVIIEAGVRVGFAWRDHLRVSASDLARSEPFQFRMWAASDVLARMQPGTAGIGPMTTTSGPGIATTVWSADPSNGGVRDYPT